MAERAARNYQYFWLFMLMNLQRFRSVARKTFSVFLAGTTNGAHRDFVEKLEGIGHTEANLYEECDYLVVFCPIASRVGTDISEALNQIRGNKRTILVVMHHTFDSNFIVAKSRRLVNHPNVELTVDCLFHDNHFLDCNQNNEAWLEVQTYLGPSEMQNKSICQRITDFFWSCWNCVKNTFSRCMAWILRQF